MNQSLVWFIWIGATGYAAFRFCRLVRLVRQYPEELWYDYSDYRVQTFAPAARAAKGALWYWLAATALLVSRLWLGWPESVVFQAAAVLFTLLGSVATFWPAVYAYLHPSPEPPGDVLPSDLVEVIDDD